MSREKKRTKSGKERSGVFRPKSPDRQTPPRHSNEDYEEKKRKIGGGCRLRTGEPPHIL